MRFTFLEPAGALGRRVGSKSVIRLQGRFAPERDLLWRALYPIVLLAAMAGLCHFVTGESLPKGCRQV
jgi:hypothetical protein